MVSKKKLIARIVVLAVILGIIGFNVYKNWIKVEKRVRNITGLDKEHSLVVVELSTEKGKAQNYIALSHAKKGFLWKYPIDRYEGPLYESRYRRDVMVKDGTISFYLGDENRLIKFDFQTGEVLKTLDILKPYDYVHWTALQDKDSLYLLFSINEEELGLQAIDFDSLTPRWEIDFENYGISDFYKTPMQNDHWIVLHREKDEERNILLINKKTGEFESINVGDWGFLKDDSYYYLSSMSSKDSLSKSFLLKEKFSVLDLKTLETKELFDLDLNENSLPKLDFVQEFPNSISVWHYRDQLVYFAKDDNNSFLLIRDLQTGDELSRISLPEDFGVIAPDLSLFANGAPEFDFYPELKSRYLPLVFGGVGTSSFESDMIEVKIVLFDLDEGKISWESRPVYQSWRTVENNLEQNNFYDDGLYGIFLPVQGSYNDIYQALLLIDGETGELTQCVRFKEKQGVYSANDFAYKGRRYGDGRIFSFSDRASFLADETWFGRHSYRYGVEDMSEEMGEVYGF